MKVSRSVFSFAILAGIVCCIIMPVTFPTFGAGPKGTVYNIVVPKQINLLYDPTYHCWVPDSVGTVRCIIVHQHGCTREGDGTPMMGDVQWQTLAKKWHAAFIAPSLITGAPGSGNTTCNNWDDMNNGSGNTYLAALDSLALRSKHPEIKTVPWALWGHSGGAYWVTAMTAKYPARIVATIAQSGSSSMSTVSAALKVPVLHHNGAPDLLNNSAEYNNGRNKGALWAYAINPKVTWVSAPTAQPPSMMGHAPRDLRMIAIPWLDACLTSRLPDQAGAAALKDMDTTNAWLGDTITKVIAPAAGYTGNKLRTGWFPNQYLAGLWKQYQAEGTILDSTPPPAPVNLTGTYANRQIKLNWDCDADLQTGIKTFIIYRNDKVLDTLKYTTTTLFTLEKGFQRWQDGDQPAPSSAPAMTYTDNSVTDTGTYTYQISCINWSGLAGPKSIALGLSRGQVTGVNTGEMESRTPRPAHSISRLAGNGKIALSAGMVDIYDLRGRLLKTAEIQTAGRIDVRALLGFPAEMVLMVKNRTR
jgi:pimeloyl-ACP methyl ester carboxylesterase